MTKYLDTSALTKYTSGNNKGHFNWKENIGKELPFQYDDLNGIIKIIDYKSINRKNLVTIQYQNNIMTTSTSNLLQLKILKQISLSAFYFSTISPASPPNFQTKSTFFLIYKHFYR